LADKLKLGTVAEMRERMGQDEFVMWSRYYARKAQAAELERLMAGG
jgi:hypothetical protein